MIELSIKPIIPKTGEASLRIAEGQNITERKQVELELQQVTQLQQAILDSANYTIISTTPDGAILTFNAAAERWLGYAAAEIIGITPTLFHDPEEIAARALELSADLGTNIEPGFEVFVAKVRRYEVEEREWSYISKDGSRFPILLSVTAMRDRDGNITGFLGIGSNITERKQIELELRQTRDELEIKVRQRTALLSLANEQLSSEAYERQQTQEALRLSQRLYSTLAEMSPVGIFHTDSQGQCLYVNKRWCEMTGMTFEEALGEGWAAGLHPEDRDRVAIEWHTATRNNLPFKSEYRWLRPDGAVMWTVGEALPEIGNDGKAIAYVGTMTDITERKQAELELQKSYNLLHSVIEGIPDPIFVKDIQGRFAIVNTATANVFGKPIAEIIGKDDTDFLPPEVSRPLIETDRQIMTTGETQIVEEEVLTTVIPVENNSTQTAFQAEMNGSTTVMRTYLSTKSVYRDAFGNIIGLVGIARDITERKQAENALRRSEALYREQATQLEITLQELRQTQSQLIQTEKISSLGQLVAGVAHEINNPINFIYGNITYTRQYTKDIVKLLHLYQQHYPHPPGEIEREAQAIEIDFILEDLPKILSSMTVGAERIREIVLSLRNFSRLDESQMKAVDIHSGIDSTLLILQHRLKGSATNPGIQVIKEYGDLPLVECYAGQLNQVFMNILVNAIDAIEMGWESSKSPTPTIRIRTLMLAPTQVAIRIADNGSGMTERVRRKLFDPFFTTKPVGKGTGLGLFISYQIVVEKHGGQLKCVSAPGVGTEFMIEIPLQQLTRILETF